ncbi:WbqC family protein [Wenyingzhuangia sp. IMCC45574]
MQKNIVLIPAYFAPIAHYAAILQSDSILFEVMDNFEKQTYRSRCYVFAANGKLLLNVPVLHKKGTKVLTTKTQISYAEDWQSQHLKSLQSAYRSSPFFEFYQDDLSSIFTTQYKTLGELHTACHNFVMDALLETKKTTTTEIYNREYSTITDFRKLTNTKKEPLLNFPTYTQVFDDKHGFMTNLSILDLLFMEGPAAAIYLEKIDLSNGAF